MPSGANTSSATYCAIGRPSITRTSSPRITWADVPWYPAAVPGSHIAGASQISCTSSGHGGGCRLSSAYGKPAVCVSR